MGSYGFVCEGGGGLGCVYDIDRRGKPKTWDRGVLGSFCLTAQREREESAPCFVYLEVVCCVLEGRRKGAARSLCVF